MADATILIVHDSPGDLQKLISALAVDFDLRMATSDGLGLALAHHTVPDLILLDVTMSERPGVETCRRFKAEPGWCDIPIILLTGQGGDQAESTVLALGAAEYIAKPFTIATAQRRIRNLLEREALRRKTEAQLLKIQATTDLWQASHQDEVDLGYSAQYPVPKGLIPIGLKGVNVHSFNDPAPLVGGNFSDIHQLHTYTFDVLMGEVLGEGRGLGGALIAAGVRSAYRQVLADLWVVNAMGTPLPTPAQIINQLHLVLTPRLAALSLSVGLVLYRFDINTGTLSYVNAGHQPGLHWSATQRCVLSVPGENRPLGVLPDAVYVQSCLPIGPGDSLLIYSHGITGARNPSGEPFGEARLSAAFAAHSAVSGSSALAIDSLHQTLAAFISDAPVQDDQTAILIEWPRDVLPSTQPPDLQERAQAAVFNQLTYVARDEQLLSVKEVQRVLSQLRVQQVELEMQNEDLRATQWQLETQRRRYFELYDLAPVGYLSVSAQGIILKANVNAAKLLGRDRRDLEKYLFANFIDPADEEIYFRLCKALIDTREIQVGELRLRQPSGLPCWVALTLDLVQEGDAAVEFRLIISDITERRVVAAELASLTALMQKTASRVPGLVFQFLARADGSSCFPFASEAIRDIYRVSPSDVREDASKIFALMHPDDHDAVLASMQTAAKELKPWRMEYRVKFDDGTVRWLSGSMLPERGPDGATMWYGVVTDVTESRHLKEALQESELRYRTVADFTGSWEYWAMPDGELRYVSPFCEQVCGYTREELYADPSLIRRMVHPQDLALFDRHEHGLSGLGRSDPIDYRIRTKQGEERNVVHVCRPVFDTEGKALGYRASNYDGTATKKLQEEVHQLAFIDPLTQLPNRRLLNDRLEHARSVGRRTGRHGALMFLDLDNFKPLNDTYGHGVGDLLLLTVAQRLLACVRGVDTVGRIGGDEFVVLLEELDVDLSESELHARSVAEKIRASLATPYLLDVEKHDQTPACTIEHHCSASIGVMVFRGEELSNDDILAFADTAMYQAKDAGRNLVRVYNEKKENSRGVT
jgi:diguanylate cyclase (GGDEF)-like protein/PAS domain S-box-containing protein